jgi:hypothetical protein
VGIRGRKKRGERLWRTFQYAGGLSGADLPVAAHLLARLHVREKEREGIEEG